MHLHPTTLHGTFFLAIARGLTAPFFWVILYHAASETVFECFGTN